MHCTTSADNHCSMLYICICLSTTIVRVFWLDLFMCLMPEYDTDHSIATMLLPCMIAQIPISCSFSNLLYALLR
uniref:Uncharacterized protein n=1 Tax=Arundo donax TaxID=35708 RepID=A0A0A9HIW8_ARUDO